MIIYYDRHNRALKPHMFSLVIPLGKIQHASHAYMHKPMHIMTIRAHVQTPAYAVIITARQTTINKILNTSNQSRLR